MIPLPKPQKYQAKLASKIQVSKNVLLERFVLVEPKEITFVAGQTVMLMIAPGVNRSMSIASVPDEKNSLLLAHDVGPMGPYSKWALAAKPGDPMTFMGPLGIFVLDSASPRNIIFVATGSGVAPFYPMAKDYLTRGGTHTITLYWGLRRDEDLFWQKEFEILARKFSNFHYTVTLSQGSETWAGKRGHLEEYLFADIKDLKEHDYYLCGGKEMTTEMRDRLRAASVPESQVKFELFY